MSVGLIEAVRNARANLSMDDLQICLDLCDATKVNISGEFRGRYVVLEREYVTIHVDDDWVPRKVRVEKDMGDGGMPVKLLFTLFSMKDQDFTYYVEIE